MKKKPTTINDLAKRLGVTPSTVSRALNDNDRISEKTKQAVLKLAKELNYRPNNIASSLRKGRGTSIGVIVPQINRHFFASVIYSIEQVLNEKGYNLLICQSSESLEKEKRAIQLLIDSRVDGILVSVSYETTNDWHLNQILRNNIPLVQFDRVINSLNTGKVIIDDRHAAYEAVKHLIEQGYKKIAHLSGPLALRIFKERQQGYLQALSEAGIDLNPDWQREAITHERGMQEVKEMFEGADRPDAFFCAGDYSALAVMDWAYENGVNVPEELGVVGFANEPFTSMVRPGITSVEQHSESMGREAAKLLIKEIEREEGEEVLPEEISILSDLIVRGSTQHRS